VGHKILPQIILLSQGVWLEDLPSLKMWVRSNTLSLLSMVEVLVNNKDVCIVIYPGMSILN
jgi:hypothetical protein